MDGQDTESVLDDLDDLDETACTERIAALQAQRERRREYIERLQEKLKALNGELAARKEEADRSKRELEQEQAKNKKAAEQRRATGGAAAPSQDGKVALLASPEAQEQKVDKVQRFIEEQLHKKVEKRSQRNERGIRNFDETDLLVEKPMEEQTKEVEYRDTVLITYYTGSEHKFNLSYRVDRTMPVKRLREDACLYWGLSEVEFILKTLENSKVHDDLPIQNCFRPNEPAHLILQEKTPKNMTLLESEIKAIEPKIGANRSRARARKAAPEKTEDSRGSKPNNADFFQQMQAVPGFYEYMTQRDRNVVGHLERIKYLSMCVYTVLLIASVLSVQLMQPPSLEYWCRNGVYDAMTRGGTNSATGQVFPEYKAIRSQDEVWDWLTNTVSSQLFSNTSHLRRDNYLPGWVQIRMQQVKPASHAACGKQAPAATLCIEGAYGTDTMGTEDMEAVRLIWEERILNSTSGSNESVVGQKGRSSTSRPWKFVSVQTQDSTFTGKEAGIFESYDASGYIIDYDLQHPNLAETFEAYNEDMGLLRSAGWIGPRTRAVHVNFLAYNGNYDFWLSSQHLLEIPLSGIVAPHADVDLFRPVTIDFSMAQDLFGLDLIRLILVAYVSFYQVYWEVKFERKKSRRARDYFCSPIGLADLGIAVTFLVVFISRYVVLGNILGTTANFNTEVGQKYRSAQGKADLYEAQLLVEACFILCVTFRTLNMFTFNRQVFVIWSTVAKALHRYSRFILIFLPIMSGFVLVGHAIFHTYALEYRTFWSSTTTTLMLLSVRWRMPVDTNRPFSIVYMGAFYIVSTLVFFNSWIAVLVQVYQTNRVECGFKPGNYAWKTWIPWRRRRKGGEQGDGEAAAER